MLSSPVLHRNSNERKEIKRPGDWVFNIPHSGSGLDRTDKAYLCQHLAESCVVWHYFPKVYILALPDFLNYPPWDWKQRKETMTPWSSFWESAEDVGVSRKAVDGVGR